MTVADGASRRAYQQHRKDIISHVKFTRNKFRLICRSDKSENRLFPIVLRLPNACDKPLCCADVLDLAATLATQR